MVTPDEHPQKDRHQRYVSRWILVSFENRLSMHSNNCYADYGIGAGIARMCAYLVTSYGMVACLSFRGFKLTTGLTEKQTNPDFIRKFGVATRQVQ